jgi:hypothetical protein
MANLVGNPSAPLSGVRKLSLGSEVAEDQIHGEVDSTNQALLNMIVAANPGLAGSGGAVAMEAFTLVAAQTDVILSRDATALIGVIGFSPEPGAIVAALGITGATIDGTNHAKVDLAGTVTAGQLLVLYK